MDQVMASKTSATKKIMISFDDNCHAFSGYSSFPIAEMCGLDAGKYIHSNEEDDILLTLNNITYRFGVFMEMINAVPTGGNVQHKRKLCPNLWLGPESPHEHITACFVVYAVIKNCQKLISSGQAEFSTNDTFLTSASIGNCLPATTEELVRMGYVAEGSCNLELKFDFLIPLCYFQNDGIFKSTMTQSQLKSTVSKKSKNFEEFEFEQLNTEEKVEGRFVLQTKDGNRFCIHKDRLSFASGFFEGLFRSNSASMEFQENHNGEMKMHDLSGRGLKQILSYVYLGKVDEDLDDVVVEVIYAVDKYLFICDLKSVCEAKLIDLASSAEVTTAQMIEYLTLAHQITMLDLKKSCMDWIYSHWDSIKDENQVKEFFNVIKSQQM